MRGNNFINYKKVFKLPKKKSGKAKSKNVESRTFSSLRPFKNNSNLKVQAEKLFKKTTGGKKNIILKQMKKLKKRLKREEKMRVSENGLIF